MWDEDESEDESEEFSEDESDDSIFSHDVSSVLEDYGPIKPLRGEDGSPLKVWQGNFASDILGADGGSEAGIYFSPRKKYASRYGSNLHGTYIGFSRPLVVTYKGEITPRDLTHSDLRVLIKKGYDGIIVKNPNSADSKSSEIIAFSSDSLLRNLDDYIDAKYSWEDFNYS